MAVGIADRWAGRQAGGRGEPPDRFRLLIKTDLDQQPAARGQPIRRAGDQPVEDRQPIRAAVE
ncbi:MAG TPA: hypothetical protein VGF55_02210, partial [Gemmataceae bacterium]